MVIYWEFTVLFLQFYQSCSISYIEIVVHLDLSQIFVHQLGYLQKILVNAKCFFHPQEVELKFRYPSVSHFTELEKLWGFFLEARSNSKITLIKTKFVVICHGKNNGGNNGYCGQRSM